MELSELYQRMEQIEEEMDLTLDRNELSLERNKLEDAILIMEGNNLLAIESITVTNIDWDATKEERKSLPKKLTIPVTLDNVDILEDICDYGDIMCDYLSDTYGYCVFGFSTTMNGEVKKDPQALS